MRVLLSENIEQKDVNKNVNKMLYLEKLYIFLKRKELNTASALYFISDYKN